MIFTKRYALYVGIAIFLAVAASRYGIAGDSESSIKPLQEVVLVVDSCSNEQDDVVIPTTPQTISMLESTKLLGPSIQSKTFSLAVSDVNGDNKDDILIGGHGTPPYLFINNGGVFSDQSAKLFPPGEKRDSHSHTLTDIDNDGDLDLVITGGGSDGVGVGSENFILKNNTVNEEVSFSEESFGPGMTMQGGRGRALIPIASGDGTTVDLYYAALSRKGFPNILLRSKGLTDSVGFVADTQHFMSKSINDRGRGVFADLNGDEKTDYLVVEDGKSIIYWNSEPNRAPSLLAKQVYTAKVADFNNDEKLDIFIGRATARTFSDNVTYGRDKLIYVIANHGNNDASSLSFHTESDSLALNLKQHIPANTAARSKGKGGIFLGKNKFVPRGRRFSTNKEQSLGEPGSFDVPGTYIWYSSISGKWSIKWIFFGQLTSYKGIINSAGIEDVSTTGFSRKAPKSVSDMILINMGDGHFSSLCTPDLAHQLQTSGATVSDFNNDSWLDVIGVRHGEDGANNGGVFILENNLGKSFSLLEIAPREIDRLHNADLIAHGFFNSDSTPDIVLTNGYGQTPGTNGSPRLMLNNSSTSYQAILVQLHGSNSNKFGIGAKLTLTDASGDLIGYRVHGLNSNVSMDTQWEHFGLGNYPAPYHLQILWPDEATTNETFFEAGQFHITQ